MTRKQFTIIRQNINKTQKELAKLLGVSKKTVESYEQGLRNIPGNIERIIYFILFKLNMKKLKDKSPCWQIHQCSQEHRNSCVAWITQEGFFCWFITGKTCPGQKSKQKLDGTEDTCFECAFFKDKLGKISQVYLESD